MIKTREYTTKLLELVEEGVLDPMQVLQSCLSYMSEADVKDMAISDELVEDGDFMEDYDGQPDEAQEWHDFDPDC